MKQVLTILVSVVIVGQVSAQNNYLDSLHQAWQRADSDSVRYSVIDEIHNYYEEGNRDSALYYNELLLQLARKNQKKLKEAECLALKVYHLTWLSRYAEALPLIKEALKIASDKKNESNSWGRGELSPGENRLVTLSLVNHMYAILVGSTEGKRQEQAIEHFLAARSFAAEVKKRRGAIRVLLADMNLSGIYLDLDRLDSALIYGEEARKLATETGFNFFLGTILTSLGQIKMKQGHDREAKDFLYQAVHISKDVGSPTQLTFTYSELAKLYLQEGQKDSSLICSIKALENFQGLGQIAIDSRIYENIYHSYLLNGQIDSASRYAMLALAAKDSLRKLDGASISDYKQLVFNEQLRSQDLAREKVVYQNKVKTYFFLGGIGILLLLALVFYRNNRLQHKAKCRIEKAYDTLKDTQQQLIQSEKMASLGEMTAGIAHEIQNPLNFVNNFSEVNKELLAELSDELKNGKIEAAQKIVKDIDDNEDKIIHHGRRADAIVKSMLQHSRSSSGQKELTDINSLCDEYLRLAYHGLRAKDKSFNAKFDAKLDPSLGKISIVPQDIGRVILNLINNAFYAVSEKKKLVAVSYEPLVIVQTKKLDGRIEIRVVDNGNGIPDSIIEKVFQPFFTTKPTGQGTGLGLSLSYDIVKAHGGELKVETREGEGTVFIIQLPISS